MKVIQFLALLCLALSTINALGMESEFKKEIALDSPVTSTATIHLDSKATSPAMITQNARPKGILAHSSEREDDDLSDTSSESSDDVSWNQLRQQMARNYKEIQDTFAKVQDLKKRSAPTNAVKKPKKVHFKEDTASSSGSESSNSSNDSDVKRMLECI